VAKNMTRSTRISMDQNELTRGQQHISTLATVSNAAKLSHQKLQLLFGFHIECFFHLTKEFRNSITCTSSKRSGTHSVNKISKEEGRRKNRKSFTSDGSLRE
jgi:hypothetical protein